MNRLKFGILFRPQAPPYGRDIVRRWKETLEAAEEAEGSGFDGVFVPEHHMMDDGYLPSPMVGMAALAARTERVDVGSAVTVLSLHHPIEIAESAAVVDVISNGRVRLGVGLGNFEPEFALFGLAKADQVGRFEESVEVIRRVWSGERLDYTGRYFTVRGRISPLPVAAQLWMGAMSEAGVRRAARMNSPWLTDPVHRLEALVHWRAVYAAAATDYGTVDDSRVILMRNGWVADSLEEVERIWWPHMRTEHWFYFKSVPRFVARFEPGLDHLEKPEDLSFHTHRADRFVVGSPDDCIESIKRYREHLGMTYLILSFRLSHGPAFERELACIRLFGSHVLPAFR